MPSEERPAQVTVYLTNYKGKEPAEKHVDDVVAAQVIDDPEEDAIIDFTAERYPLLVFKKRDGRTIFRLDEVVGWDEEVEP